MTLSIKNCPIHLIKTPSNTAKHPNNKTNGSQYHRHQPLILGEDGSTTPPHDMSSNTQINQGPKKNPFVPSTEKKRGEISNGSDGKKWASKMLENVFASFHFRKGWEAHRLGEPTEELKPKRIGRRFLYVKTKPKNKPKPIWVGEW